MKPLPPGLWDPSLQDIIDDMGGRPIELHCLLANHPQLLRAWWQYRMYSVRGGDLEQRDAELVILRVAVHMKAWYEWAAHVDRGIAAGLSLHEIERVAAGPLSPGWNEKDAALLSAVDSLISRHHIDATRRVTLAEHFSERQILDLISIQGMYVTIACIIGTWNIQIEDAVAKRLPDSVTEASFIELLSAANRD